jgi:hypothetical protein
MDLVDCLAVGRRLSVDVLTTVQFAGLPEHKILRLVSLLLV